MSVLATGLTRWWRRRPKYPPRWRFFDWTTRWGHVAMQFQWEPRDLWIGVFWRLVRWKGRASGFDSGGTFSNRLWSAHIYICVLPMLPLHVYIERLERP